MDPITIAGLVEGSISLAVQCGSVAKSLNTLAGQYKYAKLTISTMVQNLDIMQYTWDRIGKWSKNYLMADDEGFTQRLDRFLKAGYLVLEALEEDLQSYDISKMSFGQRSRLVWNENTLQGHQDRIRDQAQSMSLLLQALQLPTRQATNNFLQQSKKQFITSDESAFSIVPSEMSSRLSLSTGRTSRPNSTGSYTSMVYRQLSFEDDLFTTRVYKRNYRNSPWNSSRKKERFLDDGSVTDCDNETVASDKGKGQNNKVCVELEPQGVIDGRATANISERKAEKVAEQDAKFPLNTLEVRARYVVESSNIEQAPSMVNTDSDLYRKLFAACGKGDVDSVKILLGMKLGNRHEDFEVPYRLGRYISCSLYYCPVYAAVFNGHVEVMKTLIRRAELDNGLHLVLEKVVGRIEEDHCRPLHPVLEKVVGGIEDDHCRPLHVATLKGDLPMVKLLLEKGASVCSETGFGFQAVHLAAFVGSMEILLALVDAGGEIGCTDRYGKEPIDYAWNPNIRSYVLRTKARVIASRPADGPLGNVIARDVKAPWPDESVSNQYSRASDSTPLDVTSPIDSRWDDQAPWFDKDRPDVSPQALATAIKLGYSVQWKLS